MRFTAAFGLLLLLAACGQHERSSEQFELVRLSSDEHDKAHSAIADLGAGRIEKGLSALAELKSAAPSEGVSPEWIPEALEVLLSGGRADIADSLLGLLGPVDRMPAELQYWAANVALLRGDGEAAVSAYTLAAEDPAYAIDSLFELAMYHSVSGQDVQVAAATRRVLSIEPHHQPARALLASSLLALGDAESALEAAGNLSDAIQRWALEGQAQLQAGRPDLALDPLSKARRADPSSSLVRYLHGRAQLENGAAAAAAATLEPLCSGEDSYRDARILLATAYRQLGREGEAVALEVVQSEHESEAWAATLHRRGIAALERGDAAQASELLEEARQSRPDDAILLNDLASALASQRRFDEAERHFRHALELAPNDASLRANFAQLYVMKGELEKANALLK
jgi:Flp pilus assembly protein TadD